MKGESADNNKVTIWLSSHSQHLGLTSIFNFKTES